MPAAGADTQRLLDRGSRAAGEVDRAGRKANPIEASLLRLASAVLSEISDDWETERAYLTMEAR